MNLSLRQTNWRANSQRLAKPIAHHSLRQKNKPLSGPTNVGLTSYGSEWKFLHEYPTHKFPGT
jgi:hypothetical protein